MSRKYEAIDLMKLYTTFNSQMWNGFLTECHQKQSISTLVKTRYALQAGMDDLSKKKLNSEKMILWFIRLQRSIEMTIKKIYREKHPNPCDDPLKASDHLEYQDEKRKRDQKLELYLKKSGY